MSDPSHNVPRPTPMVALAERIQVKVDASPVQLDDRAHRWRPSAMMSLKIWANGFHYLFSSTGQQTLFFSGCMMFCVNKQSWELFNGDCFFLVQCLRCVNHLRRESFGQRRLLGQERTIAQTDHACFLTCRAGGVPTSLERNTGTGKSSSLVSHQMGRPCLHGSLGRVYFCRFFWDT